MATMPTQKAHPQERFFMFYMHLSSTTILTDVRAIRMLANQHTQDKDTHIHHANQENTETSPDTHTQAQQLTGSLK